MRVFEINRKIVVILGALAAPCVSIAAEDAGNAPRYYMAVFAHQTDPPFAETSHSFATFVKVSDPASSPGEPARIETQTISWMPATLDIHLVRLRPEPGTNLDLPSSLRLAKTLGARVSMWGPYEIKEELYKRAGAQVARLKSNSMFYKAVDRRFRGGNVSNCIHAVSDIDAQGGYLDTGTTFGEAASQLVVEHLRRWIIDPNKVHASITAELGVADDSIVRRGLIKTGANGTVRTAASP
jgi:hypothetical protein